MKTWVYIGVALSAIALLLLMKKKAAAAGNVDVPANTDMGGAQFGVIDPSTWD